MLTKLEACIQAFDVFLVLSTLSQRRGSRPDKTKCNIFHAYNIGALSIVNFWFRASSVRPGPVRRLNRPINIIGIIICGLIFVQLQEFVLSKYSFLSLLTNFSLQKLFTSTNSCILSSVFSCYMNKLSSLYNLFLFHSSVLLFLYISPHLYYLCVIENNYFHFCFIC